MSTAGLRLVRARGWVASTAGALTACSPRSCSKAGCGWWDHPDEWLAGCWTCERAGPQAGPLVGASAVLSRGELHLEGPGRAAAADGQRDGGAGVVGPNGSDEA